MKKIFLSLTVRAMAAVGVSTAHAGLAVSIGIPGPVFYRAPRAVFVQPAPIVVAPPVVVASAPVIAAPAPVVVAPAPVYYAPAPVYYAPAPVYCAPAPVVRFGFGFGGYRNFYRHGRW
jgi:hypothetical protein